MTDHTTQLPLDPSKEYAPWVYEHGLREPYGLCQCGCGNKAGIADTSSANRKMLQGHPVRFAHGHNRMKGPIPDPPNPTGLCQCGCGQKTNIARQTRTERGEVRGEHVRFVSGHNTGRYSPTLPAAFLLYCTPGEPDACWDRTGGIGTNGYGKLKWHGVDYLAHRVSYEIHHGEIPETENPHDACVCHTCDNRRCVNPGHLFIGTHQDNMDDMNRKGRGDPPRGEDHSFAKLTEADVVAIRRLRKQKVTQQRLADDFGVSRAVIRNIVKRKSWKHIP